MYDEKGKLTRAGAEEVIRSGRSVMIGSRVITQIENLPNEAEFAKGNAAAEAGARERLEKQLADTRAQLASLDASKPEPETQPEEAASESHASHGKTSRRR